MRFPIRFERWYALLSTSLFIRPSASYVEIEGDEVRVRMAWAFDARFSRRSVLRGEAVRTKPLSRGVHGFAGRWLVNGAGEPLASLTLAPGARARVLGFPVALRELVVSVDDPDALLGALRAP